MFPYDYLVSREKLLETQLIRKEKFYSSLNDGHISDEFAKILVSTLIFIWKQACCYFQIPLKLSKNSVWKHTPDLNWGAMLKYTKIKLELLTDIDKLMFIELSIRGGVSQFSNRIGKVNEPYIEVYNENEEINYLVYFDANNLYGWAIAQWLLYGGFKWVPNVQVDINFNVPIDYLVGYILEVDLEYPKELDYAHNDLPFCPDRSKPPGWNEEKLLTIAFYANRFSPSGPGWENGHRILWLFSDCSLTVFWPRIIMTKNDKENV